MQPHNFIQKARDIILKIRINRRGEWITPQSQEIREIMIAGVTYLISPFYREKGSATAIDKVARLIDKDAEISQ